jgi:hypothetical protein
MSFGQIADPEQIEDDSYLTSEQFNLLLSIDPKYKDKYNERQQQVDAQEYQHLASMSDAYDMRNDADSKLLDIKDVPMEEPDGGFVNPPNGGFPLAIPLIAALAGPVISGITSLIKGRGIAKGVRQDVIKNFVPDFLRKNRNALMDAEKRLQSAKHPKQFYRDAQNIVKGLARAVVEGSGQPADFAKKYANKYSQKLYPKLFNQMLSKTSKSEALDGLAMNNATIALPVIKYVLQKIVGSTNKAREIMKQIKPTLINGSGMYADGGFSFKKIFGFAKKAIGYALPFIKKVVGSDVGKNVIGSALNALLGKFKIGDVAKNLISSVANTGISALTGSGRSPIDNRRYKTGFRPANKKISEKTDPKEDTSKFIVKIL